MSEWCVFGARVAFHMLQLTLCTTSLAQPSVDWGQRVKILHCPSFTSSFINFLLPVICQVPDPVTDTITVNPHLYPAGKFDPLHSRAMTGWLRKDKPSCSPLPSITRLPWRKATSFPPRCPRNWAHVLELNEDAYPQGYLPEWERHGFLKNYPWGNWNPILWPFIKQTNEHIHSPQYPQTYYIARVWSNGSATSVISALGRLRQKDFSAFQASLTYKTNPSSSPKGEKKAFAWYCSWFLDHLSGLGKKNNNFPCTWFLLQKAVEPLLQTAGREQLTGNQTKQKAQSVLES